jgi:hypothetical protein
MLIELYRKLVAADASTELCVICGNEFELGSVYPVAIASSVMVNRPGRGSTEFRPITFGAGDAIHSARHRAVRSDSRCAGLGAA